MNEVLARYPHINFRYTKTHIPILPELPADYRWADEVEVEYWWHIEGSVQVNRGNRDYPPQTDIAIPIEPGLLDPMAYHS